MSFFLFHFPFHAKDVCLFIEKMKILLNNSKGRQLAIVLRWFFFRTILLHIIMLHSFRLQSHLRSLENDTSAKVFFCRLLHCAAYIHTHIKSHANDNCSSLFYHSFCLVCDVHEQFACVYVVRTCFYLLLLLLLLWLNHHHLHLDPLISGVDFFFFFIRWCHFIVVVWINIPTHQSYLLCVKCVIKKRDSQMKPLCPSESVEQHSKVYVSHFLTSIPRILNSMSPQKFRFFIEAYTFAVMAS